MIYDEVSELPQFSENRRESTRHALTYHAWLE